MRSNVHFLYRFAGIEITIPPGTAPDARFQPIVIDHDSYRDIGVFAGDVLLANLSLEPEQGRFSYIESVRDFCFGYFFTKSDGRVKVESACRAPCCPPRHFDAAAVIAAPVVRVYRHRNGISFNFAFNERRCELWKTM